MNRVSGYPYQISQENPYAEDTVTPDVERFKQIRQALETGWRDAHQRSGNFSQSNRLLQSPAQRRPIAVSRQMERTSEVPSSSSVAQRGAINQRPKSVKERTAVSQTATKVQDYFANIYSSFGSVRQIISREFANLSASDNKYSSTSPRRTVKDIKDFFTYLVSEKEETIKRIAEIYAEASGCIIKHTLGLSEKMGRIAIYLEALVVILEAKVCHGDLKPENILWDDNSFVISDFNGSIRVEDVCKRMKKEFIFESEDDKKRMKAVVQAFCANSTNLEGLINVCKKNLEQIKKLVEWKVLTGEALKNPSNQAIGNVQKVHELNEYLGTRFLPDSSTGYASDEYRDAMCDYFWRCDEVNFTKACQAFDIRAAGLTIYIILTGARTPEKTDKDYYDTLEQSLKKLKIPDNAVRIIRRMCEPKVSERVAEFRLPVSITELEELAQILQELQGQQANPQGFKSPFNSYSQSPRANNQDLTQLELIQNSIERLSFIEGDEDEGPSKSKLMERLIDELSKEDMQKLVVTLPAEDRIDAERRKEIIEQAFANYPHFTEGSITLNGKQCALLVLLDPQNPHASDVLVRKEMLGEGGSAIAYKALSLYSMTYVVVKYCQELADPGEMERAQQTLSHIGQHRGVQKPTRPYTLCTKEGNKKVEVDSYYKNCDYGIAVHGEILCSRLQIPRDRWNDYEAVKAAFFELNNHLKQSFMTNSPIELKTAQLKAFIKEYGSSLMGVLGAKRAQQLFEDYNALIDETPPAAAESSDKEEVRKSPRAQRLLDASASGLTKIKQARQFLVKRLTPTHSANALSRQGSLTHLDDCSSWPTRDGFLNELSTEAENPLSKCIQADKTYELVNITALTALLNDSNFALEEQDEIKFQAKQTVLQSVRQCQRVILLDSLIAQSNLTQDDDPLGVVKSWRKMVDNLGDTHLDLNGINHIAKLMRINIKVLADESCSHQKTLQQLIAHKTRVWEILS